MHSFEWDQRTQIIRKLDLFLDDFDFSEELTTLRYNQCFIVVPEAKRGLMQNFQNWQPRVSIQRLEEEPPKVELESSPCVVTDVQSNLYDDIIVEDDPDCANEMIDEDYVVTEVADEEFFEITEPTDTKSLKPSKTQRQWVNDTTRTCHSVKETDEGIVPVWTCLFCGKVYRSAQALRLHLLAKHLKGDDMVSLTDELREWIREQNRDRRVLIETIDGNKFEWTCGICKFTCTASRTFRTHLIETHINNKKPAALEASEQTLNYHQQQWIQSQLKPEPDEHVWKCLKCELSFTSDKLLKQHLTEDALKLTADDFKTMSKTGSARPRKSKAVKFQWTCNECWFQFSAQRSYDSHMKLHETLREMNQFTAVHHCKECNMFFRNVDDLSTHSAGHTEGQFLLVPAEGIALQKTILFKRLTVAPEDAQEGQSTCGHCGRNMDGEINCKSHLLLHHVNPLLCPRDGRQFNAMQPYLCHLQKVHSDLFPQSLLCTHCKMSFDNIYERLAHMKLCSEKKFSCDHCDRKYSNKNYLNSHLKREMGLLSCSCPVCGKVLKAKDELKIHMRSHTKEVRLSTGGFRRFYQSDFLLQKPYKCSICEKSYTTTSARASHMETHKDTVIQCEICAVKFVARRHYIVHYKRYHDEDYRQRKFDEQTCQFCAKQFLRKDRLREHMQRAHGNELL